MFPKHKPHTLGFSRFCCISTYYACSYDSDSLPFQQQTPKQRQDSRGCRLYSVVCHLAQTFWNPVPTSGGLRPASFFLKKKKAEWLSFDQKLFILSVDCDDSGSITTHGESRRRLPRSRNLFPPVGNTDPRADVAIYPQSGLLSDCWCEDFERTPWTLPLGSTETYNK